MSYSTFWNDFSHYTAYGRSNGGPVQETPLDYWDMSQFQGMFQDSALYVEKEAIEGLDLVYSEDTFNGKNKMECLNLNQAPSNLDVYAHIPQDFNLDVHTTGSISGFNQGDSKFLGMQARLVTSGASETISARRLRCDDCFIET